MNQILLQNMHVAFCFKVRGGGEAAEVIQKMLKSHNKKARGISMLIYFFVYVILKRTQKHVLNLQWYTLLMHHTRIKKVSNIAIYNFDLDLKEKSDIYSLFCYLDKL